MLAANSFSTGVLGVFVLRRRCLLLKPSIIFIAYYQLSVMWPTITWYDYLVDHVSDLQSCFTAIHVFGVLATLLSVLTWHRTVERINRRINSSSRPAEVRGYFPIILLCIALAMIACWYLLAVGWRNTGLFTIISKGDDAAQARESSFKLISSPALRYAWSAGSTAIAYILAYLLARKTANAMSRGKVMQAGLMTGIYALVLFVVMLPGSRAPAAMVFLTTLFGYYVYTGFRLSLAWFLLLAALGMFAPAILSLLREQQDLNIQNIAIYYLDILDRFAGRSVQDNIWMISYVQGHGYFGVAGIPPLARLAGIEPVNVFNIVGLFYMLNGVDSVSANASFPLVNYGCFGPAAIWISLALTFSMDSLLWLQSGLPRNWLIPSCGICAIISMNFVMTMFTTVFITHGLLLTIFICYGFHFINTRSYRASLPSGQ